MHDHVGRIEGLAGVDDVWRLLEECVAYRGGERHERSDGLDADGCTACRRRMLRPDRQGGEGEYRPGSHGLSDAPGLRRVSGRLSFLRRLTSAGENMVPRQFGAPQKQGWSSWSESWRWYS